MISGSEISLLDYEGTVDKNVDWHMNESYSGICLNGFKISAEEMATVTGGKVRKEDGDFDITVVKTVQYKPWRFGKTKPGSGQMGIYKIKDQNGKEWYALIKDYRAFEGDWRIMLMLVTKTEQGMKDELTTDELGFLFMDYLFPNGR